MTSPPNSLDDKGYYQALLARDARFDGHFFIAVKTTGIYCRPVCKVRAPLAKNCLFFNSAALAESQGFRPCLRCRPELAPQVLPHWSAQDASQILALQASQLIERAVRLLKQPLSVAAFAQQLGVSERHLNRIFNQHLGVSPSQYLLTQRLLMAKQLLSDTTLPIHQISKLSGFSSQRRLNAVFIHQYNLTPSACRKGELTTHQLSNITLTYRPPYHVQSVLNFFSLRAINGLERVNKNTEGTASLARIFQIRVDGNSFVGWIELVFDEQANRVKVRLSDSLMPVLPAVLQQIRWALDLDADCQAIDTLLQSDFPNCLGWRVPGAWDGFETAVRAILGQQVTVAAAKTLTHRLVKSFGAPVATPWPELTLAFPSPETLFNASPDELGKLGIVKQRQKAIQALANALLHESLDLSPGPHLSKTLKALMQLPGIGDWTAQYIAMRCLRWPDAFPSGDVVIQNRLGVRGLKRPALQATEIAQKWQPWRSYAVIRLWHGDSL
ncbi:Ada metal-binding domain-containing protein [Limnohabitans sp. Rim8]|uniref:DNA-3-methyladenine glycosylase 2 family protein n=1 Tax=Limnohabitans sp. Rim8 TaxID=1100718 RepID=UPI0026119FFC|nr:Ada metal-binding domain-containing protein [Limnohabitans sp. Rim8]